MLSLIHISLRINLPIVLNGKLVQLPTSPNQLLGGSDHARMLDRADRQQTRLHASGHTLDKQVIPVSYTHLDVYKRQVRRRVRVKPRCTPNPTTPRDP